MFIGGSIKLAQAEKERVRERFQSELAGEFEFLKEELGLSAAETLFTVDAATLVTLGTAVAVGGTLGITAAAVAAARSVLGKVTQVGNRRERQHCKSTLRRHICTCSRMP